MPSIHVCPLALVEATVAAAAASRLVTCLRPPHVPATPAAVAPADHLVLAMDDIEAPQPGSIAPDLGHAETLVAYVRAWDRATALVIHCHAGISRSTAAAFIALCALNPDRDERAIARRLREVSPSAWPNGLLVAHGDRVLGRRGRMRRAVEAIGPGAIAGPNQPFSLPAALA